MRASVVVGVAMVGLIAACGSTASTATTASPRPVVATESTQPAAATAAPTPTPSPTAQPAATQGPSTLVFGDPPAAGDDPAQSPRDTSDATAAVRSLTGQAQGVQSVASPEGTQVWGTDDGCVWQVVSGYWVRTGLCRVPDVSAPYVSYLYPLGQPTSEWFREVDSDPAITSNGQNYVYLDKAVNYWESCPTANCTDELTSVYFQGAWYTTAQLQQLEAGLAAELAAQQQAALAQAQQQAQQAAQQQAQQAVQAQGGGQSALDALYGNPIFAGALLSQANLAEVWVQPDCDGSLNGCR